MIWYAAAMPGRLEDQTELLADPRLPLEVGQSGGSEHGFGRTLGRVGIRTYQRGQVLIAYVAHVATPTAPSSAGRLASGPRY